MIFTGLSSVRKVKIKVMPNVSVLRR